MFEIFIMVYIYNFIENNYFIYIYFRKIVLSIKNFGIKPIFRKYRRNSVISKIKEKISFDLIKITLLQNMHATWSSF